METTLILVVIILLVVVAGIIYRNIMAQDQFKTLTEKDHKLADQACVDSVNARNLKNKILALMTSCYAHCRIECINDKYGSPSKASQVLGVDTGDAEKKFKIQRNRILKDIIEHHPDLLSQEDYESMVQKDV